jgi:hypothetical protein
MTTELEKKKVTTIDGFVTIEQILDKFDFEKVHAYMLLTKWKWHLKGEMRIPEIHELKAHASYFLWQALENGRNAGYVAGASGSGGFYADYHIYNNKECLKLSFVLTHAST